MTNVNPSALMKMRSGDIEVVGTDEQLERYTTWVGVNTGYVCGGSRPLTQRDLERVAALAMMPPGTEVDGLGHVWPSGDVFTLFDEQEN